MLTNINPQPMGTNWSNLIKYGFRPLNVDYLMLMFSKYY